AGYHRRSIAESAIVRLKTVLGDNLTCSTFVQQQVEVKMACAALNKMAALGRPRTSKVKAAAYPKTAEAKPPSP
ncbi:MAG: hypothetical protein ICV79_22975, partial [Flavisolibacter sp.]|nr:hypothetical protein [Flavisolibacter sp.]